MLAFIVPLCLIALLFIGTHGNEFSAPMEVEFALPSDFAKELDVAGMGIPARETKRTLTIGSDKTFSFDTTINLNNLGSSTAPTTAAATSLFTLLSVNTGVTASAFQVVGDTITGSGPTYNHAITLRCNLNTNTVTGFVDYRDIGVVAFAVKNKLAATMDSGILIAALKLYSIQVSDSVFTSATLGSYSFSETMDDTPAPASEDDDNGDLKRGRIAAVVIFSILGFFAISGILYYGITKFRNDKKQAEESS